MVGIKLKQLISVFIFSRADVTSKKFCFALSHNKFGKLQTLPVQHSEKPCHDGFKCFISLLKDLKEKKKYHCDGDGN